MQTIVVLIGITLSASQNAPIAPESVESLKLENRVLRLDICRSPAPFIERLTHKVSGRAVVAAPGSRNLFSITFAHKDGKQETIEGAAAGESDVSVMKVGTTSQVVMKYQGFPAPDLAVEVTAVCDEQDLLTRWTMRIAHNPGWRLRTVRFPQLLSRADHRRGKGRLSCAAGPRRHAHSEPGGQLAQWPERDADVITHIPHPKIQVPGHPRRVGADKIAGMWHSWQS